MAKKKATKKKAAKKKVVKKKTKRPLEETEKQFIKEYSLSEDDYINSKINITNLASIRAAYTKEKDTLKAPAAPFLETLREIEEVHSLRMRIKGTDRLIKKIIRKQIEDKTLEITLDNYEEHIKDKIGIRVLHLYKTDWLNIHKYITETWDLWEEPFAYIREGDDTKSYAENGLEVKIHEKGYRSVHFLVKTKPMKKEIPVEIQVRTLFEEGWSEIDHRIRYPDNLGNVILNSYLAIFNRLSGSADEMGTFILNLKDALGKKEEEKVEIHTELQGIKAELKTTISELGISQAKKNDLEKKVEALSDSNTQLARESLYSTPEQHTFDGTFAISDLSTVHPGILLDNAYNSIITAHAIIQPQKCRTCEKEIQYDPFVISNGLCSTCNLASGHVAGGW